MPPKVLCRTCGTPTIRRRANAKLAQMVQKLTGQNEVWEYICPQCYPDKIAAFVKREEVEVHQP